MSEQKFLACLFEIKLNDHHQWRCLPKISSSRFDFAKFIAAAPKTYGIYRFFDSKQKIIYVGKANNLHSRLKSYFNKSSHRPDMEPHIYNAYLVFINNESSSYELEYGTYLKYYIPYYNKTSPEKTKFLALQQIPLVTLNKAVQHRDNLDPKAGFIGPFLESRVEIHQLLKTLQLAFKLPDCSSYVFKKGHPCETYLNQRCDAPCYFKNDNYPHKVEQLLQIVKKGKKSKAFKELTLEQKNILDPVIDYLPAQTNCDLQDVTIYSDIIAFTADQDMVTLTLMEIHRGMLVDIRNLQLEIAVTDFTQEILEATVVNLITQLEQQRVHSVYLDFKKNRIFYIINNLFTTKIEDLQKSYNKKYKFKLKLNKAHHRLETLIDLNGNLSRQFYRNLKNS